MEAKDIWVAGQKAPYRLYQAGDGRIVESTGDPGAAVLIERGDEIPRELADRLANMLDNGLSLSVIPNPE